jgi:hypothetical protein
LMVSRYLDGMESIRATSRFRSCTQPYAQLVSHPVLQAHTVTAHPPALHLPDQDHVEVAQVETDTLQADEIDLCGAARGCRSGHAKGEWSRHE